MAKHDRGPVEARVLSRCLWALALGLSGCVTTIEPAPVTDTGAGTGYEDEWLVQDSGAAPVDAGEVEDSVSDAGPVDAEAADVGCVPTSDPKEICDGLDNDCDGAIDDGAPCDDGNACTEESCDSAVGKETGDGCTYKNLEGTGCNDGDKCTTGDTCGAGLCKPAGKKSCDDGNGCTHDACKVLTGACSSTPLTEGQSCDDGQPCTVGDACQGGKCTGKPSAKCDDGDPCTIDGCDALGNCTWTPSSVGGCEDGNPCTDKDVCVQGKCVPGGMKVCDDGNPCTNDMCDIANGGCVTSNKLMGTPCTPLDKCASEGACNALGSCIGKNKCDDGKKCTIDTCDDKTGACLNTKLAVGTPCDDGKPCTKGEKCNAQGICDAGGQKGCDDGNPCTKDECVIATLKCTNKAIVGPCDDGDACTLGEKCLFGKCMPGPSQKVSTVAGQQQASYKDGPPLQAYFNQPRALALAADGATLYIADANNHRIRKLPLAGQVSTVAGSGQSGFADGWGTAAKFNNPEGIAVDAGGVVYVADYGNHRIRKINTQNQVTTLAGSGSAAYADGSGTGASFSYPEDLVVDAAGNVWVADSNNNRIRKVDPQGKVTTFAGSTVGFADGQGTAAKFNRPNGIALDGKGVLWVADGFNHRIRRVLPDGTVSTFAGAGNASFYDAKGTQAMFNYPYGIDVDTAGNLYVADRENHRVRLIDKQGFVTTLAGLGAAGFLDGKGVTAKFSNPWDVVVGKDGAVYVADAYNNRIRRVDPSFKICDDASPCTKDSCDKKTGACKFDLIKAGDTCDDGSKCTSKDTCDFAGKCKGIAKPCSDGKMCTKDDCNKFTGECFYTNTTEKCDDGDACTKGDQCLDGECSAGPGDVQTWAGSGNKGNGDGPPVQAQFSYPQDIALGAGGLMYVADTGNHRIRRLDPKGNVMTFAGSGSPGWADGSGTAAKFNAPVGIAVEVSGMIYVADRNNHRIRKIDPKGKVSTLAGGSAGFADGQGVAARFYYPEDVEVDNAGNIFVADSYNNRIRKISASGTVTTVAGYSQGYKDGKGKNARFYRPFSLAMNSKGLVVADRYNHRLRLVLLDGTVSTIAGAGTAGALDGQAMTATFNSPESVTVDEGDNVWIADRGNHRVRRLTKGGVVQTIAGSAGVGFQNGPGGVAKFSGPAGIAAGKNGAIFIADRDNQRIRRIAPSIVSCSDGKDCTLDTCDKKTAVCSHKQLVAGDKCSDDNACTLGDTCDVKGACVGSLKSCDDGNGCTFDACNPKNGACLHAPHQAECSDGDFCTDADTCVDGTCVGDIGTLKHFSGSGSASFMDGASNVARFFYPRNATVGQKGYVYIADYNNHRIRRVAPNGTVSTLAGAYAGYANAKGTAARFYYPHDVAADPKTGVLYVADRQNRRIRRVTPDGTVSLLAGSGSSGFLDGPAPLARFYYPSGVAVAPNGDVIVADTYNRRIRRVTQGGQVSTIAGNGLSGLVDGKGTAARFNRPYDVAVDSKGVIYVADTNNHAIRKVDGGVVSTIAGSGKSGFADGVGKAAMFASPYGVAVGPGDEVYVADTYNYRIRKLLPGNKVITFAGLGKGGYKDGFALQGMFNRPMGLTFDGAGNMYIVDTYNQRIRFLSSTVKTCDDGTECTQDKCNSKDGKCEHSKVADGAPCVGGKPCLLNRLCNVGVCVGGYPKTCDDGNSCTNDSCDPQTGQCVHKPGPNCKTERRVFLTSMKYSGALGGAGGAHAKCQVRAAAAKLGGTWKAWISDYSTYPAIHFNKSNSPYVLLNGVTIAKSWSDLVDGSLAAPIDVDEFGKKVTVIGPAYCKSLTGPKVFTNTTASGSRYSSSSKYSCSQWKTASSSSYYRPVVGMANKTDGRWTFHICTSYYTRCYSSYPAHLYCFEQTDHYVPK